MGRIKPGQPTYSNLDLDHWADRLIVVLIVALATADSAAGCQVLNLWSLL